MTQSGPILVTGAAGFIGSHVVAALTARGTAVVGLDNFDPYYDRAIKLRNSREVGLGGAKPLVEADICDDAAMRRVFDEHRPVGVIHLAGKAGVRPSIADPAGYMHTNVTGTARVLAHAQRVGCSRVVVASSSSVYGNCTVSPFSEELDVSTPISPYAASKRACELLAHTHVHLTKQPVACLRFFTVFGPRQRPDLAISAFLQRVSAGEAIAMFGDGTTARDYTFVDDIVQGVLSAYDAIPAHGYRVWNLGNNKPVSLREMIAAIERTVGTAAKIDRKPMQPGDVELTCADISRSQRELGYQPRTSFAEGLAKQWAWMQGVAKG
ncbi:MAG TPA: NAD-dependent epimerase/dehydratase family protein [Phycisphaerales bacterium]|nr:NAD-dependent epimerase/dehydratase family protein [Phycisphaerales bacterium]